MRVRVLLRNVHLWLSLLFGAFFLTLSCSGGLLVFHAEIDRLLSPELFRVHAGEVVPFDQVLRAVEAAYPDRQVQLIAAPASGLGNGAYLAQLSPEPALDVFVDPGSGEVLGARHPGHTLTGWLTELHIYLFAGRPGELFLGGCGVVLLVVLLSGAYLWWPGWGRLRSGFQVRTGKGVSLFSYDLHKLLGVITSPVLALIVFTGLLFALGLADRVVYALFLKGPPARPESTQVTAPPSAGARLGLDEWQRRAEQAVPGAVVTFITLPKRPQDPALVRLQAPGSPHPNGCCRVALDPYTGAVLGVQDERTFAAPDALRFRWLYPLHIGSYGGLTSRLVHLFVSLMPLLLLLTGLVIWWRRREIRSRLTSRPGLEADPEALS